MSEHLKSRRRWVIAVAGVVLLLVALRIALPIVLRSVLVSQGNALLAGRFSVANVDLWLLRGAIAIEGIELQGGGAAPGVVEPDAEPPQEASAATLPRAALRRLYVDLRWWPLLHRTVELDEIAIDGPELDVERESDGVLALPALRPAQQEAPAPESAEAKPAEPSKPWNVVVDAARLHDGKVLLVDHVADPPRQLTLSLDGLELLGFRLLPDVAEEEPGKGTIAARFGDGTMKLSTSLATRAEGFAVAASVELENLPLDRLNVHVPQLGWSDLRGRLDGKVDVHLEPDGLPIVWGSVALRDVQVDVPGEDEPALAWRRLDVDLERLDVERREVAVRRVALDGAGVLVRPRAPGVLPLLPHPAASPAAVKQAAPPTPAPDANAPRAPPWSWRVATLQIDDAMAKLILEPPPLEIGIVSAKVDGLSSDEGSRATVALQVREGAGTVTLAGDVALRPLAASLQLGMDALALERYAAAAGVTPPVLRRGNLGGDLKIDFGPGPTTVSGKLAVADLDVGPAEGEDFGVAWQRLEIALRELRIPRRPAPSGGSSSEPIRADLTRVALTSPKIRLTRTADGIVLPAVSVAPASAAPEGSPPAGAVASEGGAPDAIAPEPSPVPAEPTPVAAPAATATAAVPEVAAATATAPPAAAAPIELTLGELAIDGGEVAVTDRTVQPFYRGRLAAIALVARGLAYPSNRFREVRLTAQAPGGTPLKVHAQQKGSAIEVEVDAERLALPPLNPYVTGAAGYSISRGTFTLASKLRWTEDGYQSESSLAFDDLDVAGVEGDSLFAQRFGVSLSLALALLRDVSGRIALTVPVSGDRSGSVRPDLAPIVAESLSRALINALASPLKLLGALSLEGDKVSAFAPEPIAFVAGKNAVDDASWWRVEQLANVLAASPAVRVELAGTAGAADVRALQEAAVLADLEQDQGLFATLRNLPSRGARGAIRTALTARASGEPGELDPDDAATLEEWVAAKTISDDDLRTLADARQQRLRDLLASDYGVAAERVLLLDPAVDRDATTTVVNVTIGARG